MVLWCHCTNKNIFTNDRPPRLKTATVCCPPAQELALLALLALLVLLAQELALLAQELALLAQELALALALLLPLLALVLPGQGGGGRTASSARADG